MPNVKNAKIAKPRVASAAPVLPATASIVLNLTAFYPIHTAGQYCVLGDAANAIPPLTIISNAGGGVTYPAGGLGTNGIVIKRKNIILTISLNVLTGGQGPYAIAGLTFVPNTGAPADQNFSISVCKPTQATFVALGTVPKATWKLFVSVLDSSSGAPVLGLIDPDLENEIPVLAE